MEEIVAFHGTNLEIVESIQKYGFKISTGKRHWLGDGVYFFIEGKSSDPYGQAKQWAILNAWDNKNKQLKYNFYSVIECTIKVNRNKLWDLTKSEDIEIFNFIEKEIKNKIPDSYNKGIKYCCLENFVITIARELKLIDFDVIKADTTIKLEKEHRVHNTKLKIANCTICSVFNPDIVYIKEIKEGEI